EPEGVSVRAASLRAGFNVPLRIAESLVLIPGASYELLSLRQEGEAIGLPGSQEFHAVTGSALLGWRMADRWSLTAQVAATLAGDFVDVGVDHLQAGGMVLLSHSFSDRFSLGAGVLVSNQFGEILPLPAIQVDWRIAETVWLRGLLPAQLRLTWSPHDRLELGLVTSVRGQSYALTSSQGQTQWPCADEPDRNAEPDSCFRNLAYSQGEVGPWVGFRLRDSIWLSARATMAVFRRYEFRNADGEIPEVGDLGLDSNLNFRVQLAFRIPRT
ncbi:MAG: DUF6268 family outer membrane beta-barrel protein, partial [Myxococcota bacterium]